jgi:RNA polymerase sigma-70 factor (ECF subfamily)
MASNHIASITFPMLDGTSNEKKLIQDAVKGKSSAFGALYDRYQPMIYRFVFVKVGRREDAEDITHQVFVAAWTNVRSYKDLGHPFSSWLYQIARNQVIDHYRAKKQETSLENMDPEYFVIPATAHFDVATKMEFEKVRVAIAKMKPDYQDVIVMRFIEDLPLKEVAKAMDRTEGAIKLMQHRAMKELKKLL